LFCSAWFSADFLSSAAFAFDFDFLSALSASSEALTASSTLALKSFLASTEAYNFSALLLASFLASIDA
jgi:hypothetical protein